MARARATPYTIAFAKATAFAFWITLAIAVTSRSLSQAVNEVQLKAKLVAFALLAHWSPLKGSSNQRGVTPYGLKAGLRPAVFASVGDVVML